VAKERARALVLAQDKMAEVKKRGYQALIPFVSKYYYPDQPDPAAPMSQLPDVPPYPATAPAPGEDPWTPETILSGKVEYWRHVKIKCVEDTATGLQQRPLPNLPTVVGGTDDSSNLMHIEVAVTWFSRLAKKIRQVRVTSMLANMKVTAGFGGEISGTIFDDADDTLVTGKTLTVYTTHPGTGQSFSVPVDPADGSYFFSDLPDGEYIIKLAGEPEYLDSAHAVGNSDFDGDPCSEAACEQSIVIETGDMTHLNKGIWTVKVYRVHIVGRFTGASPGDIVFIDSADGLSSGIKFDPVSGDCDATPCSFTISDVAWPVVGTKTFQVTLENRTQGRYGTATICMIPPPWQQSLRHFRRRLSTGVWTLRRCMSQPLAQPVQFRANNQFQRLSSPPLCGATPLPRSKSR